MKNHPLGGWMIIFSALCGMARFPQAAALGLGKHGGGAPPAVVFRHAVGDGQRAFAAALRHFGDKTVHRTEGLSPRNHDELVSGHPEHRTVYEGIADHRADLTANDPETICGYYTEDHSA